MSSDIHPTAAQLDQDPLLTTGEVAALARVSTKTVTRWAREARLAGVAIGGQWRFHLSEVQALLRGER